MFFISPFRFTKERLNTSKKNNNIKTHPATKGEWRGERKNIRFITLSNVYMLFGVLL